MSNKKAYLPKVVKKITVLKEDRKISTYFAIRPILPQLIIIALCIGLYHVMINYYLFFQWGLYIYYCIKLVIALAILSAARRSPLVPLGALLVGLIALFTNSFYTNTLIAVTTAWELVMVALVGLFFTLLIRLRLK